MQKAEERELKKELKRKLAGIFANYVDDIKENNKISRSKIYELIADNMNVAADTVRKYRSEQDGIAEKQAQNLLNACIRFEVENHLRRTKLSKFVDEYKETIEKLIGEPLDIRDPELPYIADYFHIMKREDEKQWNSTVCPPELEKCLNNFFKEKKHLLIVQGTKKSGLTVSVTKYIIDRQKKKPVIVPYIFDIEGKGDKELRDWENLQKALKGEYVIIRIGHQKFEYYDFLRNAKAKIIVLAHNKVGVDNVAGAETVVFNDLVNHIKCTEQMVKMYSSELYEDLKDQKEELKFTLEKIHSITGGLPAAIRKIGSLIWKLYHVDGIGIREIFADFIQHIADAQAGSCGYRNRITNTQVVELIDIRHELVEVINLVDHQNHGLAGFAQHIRHLGIRVHQSLTYICDKNDHVRRSDRDLRLLTHLA